MIAIIDHNTFCRMCKTTYHDEVRFSSTGKSSGKESRNQFDEENSLLFPNQIPILSRSSDSISDSLLIPKLRGNRQGIGSVRFINEHEVNFKLIEKELVL